MTQESQMELTFLGTGTSFGVPQLNCDCEVCRSTDPHDRRQRTSAIINVSGKNLLIDCGPDFRYQILENGRPVPDALLVTHSHYDHLGGIDDLRPYSYVEGGFPIFCREDVAQAIHDSMPYCFEPYRYPGAPVLDLHVIDTAPFQVHGIEVMPLPVMHTATLLITGYRIGKLSYVTDCKTMPQSTIELMRGTDTLVINALKHEPHDSHMNLKEAIDVIHAVGPRRALLTHIAHQMGLYAEVSRMLPQGIELAFDGLTIEI